jgi:hypothetical protein
MNNFLTAPILSFFAGVLVSQKAKFRIPPSALKILTLFLLFSIGFKGGSSMIQSSSNQILILLAVLVLWAFLQPFVSYFILRQSTKIDSPTAAAVAACFGSVSVMTFIGGETFLEKMGVPYNGAIVTALAVLEIPALISGLAIAQVCNITPSNRGKTLAKDVLLNKTVIVLLIGMFIGALSNLFNLHPISLTISLLFKPSLSLFLFSMGLLIGVHREQLKQFSWPLALFGFYTPLLNGFLAIVLGYFLHLDLGTTTLVAVLFASASYIVVPAAMRLALPEAKEGIYLPLSLGITFPFNVIFGIPLYYYIASKIIQ